MKYVCKGFMSGGEKFSWRRERGIADAIDLFSYMTINSSTDGKRLSKRTEYYQ